MGEIIFLLCFLVVSIYMYVLTGSFRISKMDRSGGAAMFPRIVIVLLMICLLLRMLQIFREKEKREFVWKNLFSRGRMEFTAALVVYVICLKPLGYIVTTCAFLFFTVNRFYYLEEDNLGTKKGILIRSVVLAVFAVIMYFVFSGVLAVSLPKGILKI